MAERSPVSYRVAVDPQRHELGVEMRFTPSTSSASIRVETPTWVAGDYDYMAFARDIFAIRAFDASGRELGVVRDGWQGFVVPGNTARITYRAAACAPEFAEPCGIVDDRFAIALGTRYLHLAGAEGPCRVEYQLPDDWAVHHPSGAVRTGNSAWEYPSYEILVDTPVAMGHFDLRTRVVRGTPFHCLFVDRTVGFESGVESLVDRLAGVGEALHDVFGSFPFEDYTFILSFNPTADWGLEHLTSTMCGLGPDVFVDPDRFAYAVRVCAHEAFHAWNVRRLRPAPLKHIDFTAGDFTQGLWVAEGFTRYYEFLLSVRAGLYTAQQFFSNAAEYFNHLAVTPAYSRVTAADSSLATYLNHSKYPGRCNNAIDYYDKGMLIAFGADVALRTRTQADNLDRAFSDFYRAFVEISPGYTPRDVFDFFDGRLPELGHEIAAQSTSLAPLPVTERFKALGFEPVIETLPYLGIVFLDSGGPEIYDILDTSPASTAGLAPGDVITKIDGYPYSSMALGWVAANARTTTLEVQRGHRALSYTLSPAQRTRVAALVWRGTPQQAGAIRTWLQAAFEPAAGQSLGVDFYQNFHGVETVV